MNTDTTDALRNFTRDMKGLTEGYSNALKSKEPSNKLSFGDAAQVPSDVDKISKIINKNEFNHIV